MHVTITFFSTTVVLIVVLFAVGRDMLATFGDVSDAWHLVETRTEKRFDTKVTGPMAVSVSTTSTVQATIVNEGRVRRLGRNLRGIDGPEARNLLPELHHQHIAGRRRVGREGHLL